ncbi:hypothetical protein ACM66B_003515 [Microbotryomycetes sp. NB124-2]
MTMNENDKRTLPHDTPATGSNKQKNDQETVAGEQDDGARQQDAADSTPIRPAKRARLHDDQASTPVEIASESVKETVGAGDEAARGAGEQQARAEGSNDKHQPPNRREGGKGGKRNNGRDKKGTYDKRAARQQQQAEKGTTKPDQKSSDQEGGNKERLPKKKVAVLVGYNGAGYKGSQINPGMPTLEGTIFEAMIKAGVISDDNADDHAKVGLSRAARTDAGVHAAFNVLSLKMILAPPSKPAEVSLEDHINSFLPPTIRVWTVIRVQGAFNPRTMCDQRQYEYTMPTHVLLGPKPGTNMAEWLVKSRAAASKAPSSAMSGSNASATEPGSSSASTSLPPATVAADKVTSEFWSHQPKEGVFADDLAEKRKWRITPELLQAAREFVRAYEGSHNFYNFTVGKDFRDRSAQRLMRKLEISDPFVVNGTEYISVGFLGQSFMLHQIRKMVGLMILAVRSGTPPSLIAETFGPSRIHIPKAPALGLVLIGPQYMEYNRRIDESNKKLAQQKSNGKVSAKEAEDGTRDKIVVEGALLDKINQFKMETLYGPMREREDAENIFSKWLNYLDVLGVSDFEYLNPKGVIPSTAVYQKGQDPEKTRAAAAAAANQTKSNDATTEGPGGSAAVGAEEDEDEEMQGGAEDG